jgi:hypothetical protein
MWVIKVALNRSYTFIVVALLILLVAPVMILRSPADIFPNINIPVIAVSWTYTGLNPGEMEGRITTVYERVLTTLVDNIEHIESTTVNGTSAVKIGLGLFQRIWGGMHPAILNPIEDVVPPDRAIGKETVHSILLVRKHLEHGGEFCRNHQAQMGGVKVQQFQCSIQAHDARITEHQGAKAVRINLGHPRKVEYEF